MLTKQEIFNTAYKGVLAQTGVAFDGMCSYLNAGNRCAVGQFFKSIPDERITEIEGSAIGLLLSDPKFDCFYSARKREAMVALLTEVGLSTDLEDLKFLQQLQRCHDDPAEEFADDLDLFRAQFKENMSTLARTYNLEIPNE